MERENSEGLGYGVTYQNGVGIEYWPPEVADELTRVHPKGNYFIPNEEMLVAGLDGHPLICAWDLVGCYDVNGPRFLALCSAREVEDETDTVGDDRQEILNKAVEDALEIQSIIIEEALEAATALRAAISDEDEEKMDYWENALAFYEKNYPELFRGDSLATIEEGGSVQDFRRREIIESLADDELSGTYGTACIEDISTGKRRRSQGVRSCRRAFLGKRTHKNTKRNKREHWATRDSIRFHGFNAMMMSEQYLAWAAELEMSIEFDRRIDRLAKRS